MTEATASLGGTSPARQAWRRLRRNVLAMLGLGLTVLIVLAVIGAPLLTQHDPTLMRPWLGALPPGADHPDVQAENRFAPGKPAESTLAITALPWVAFDLTRDTVTTTYRLTLSRRTGAVRAIEKNSADGQERLEALHLTGQELELNRIIDPIKRHLADFPQRFDVAVGERLPAGILAEGELALLLQARQPTPQMRYRIELDTGTVRRITCNGVPMDGDGLVLRAKQIAAVTGPAGPVRVAHLLGTDQLGRDLYARILYGGRISLMVGIVATAVSLLIGVFYGAIAGYLGGRSDRLMMGAVDILYGLPFMFLVILLMAFFGRNIFVLFAALGAVQWLTMARIVRGQTLSLRNAEFIQAARLSGCTAGQIIRRHLVPNCLGPVIIYTTLTIPLVILEESFLAFLGLQVEWHGLVSWGGLVHDGMLDAGEGFVMGWLLWWPAGIMTTTLLALNALGSGLRDALDPRLQEGRS